MSYDTDHVWSPSAERGGACYKCYHYQHCHPPAELVNLLDRGFELIIDKNKVAVYEAVAPLPLTGSARPSGWKQILLWRPGQFAMLVINDEQLLARTGPRQVSCWIKFSPLKVNVNTNSFLHIALTAGKP